MPFRPIGIVDALLALKLVASKGEARRLIAGGGARIDGEKASDNAMIMPGTEPVRVSAGKKLHGLIIR
jgi:tyrosyl-tRNA synthetase